MERNVRYDNKWLCLECNVLKDRKYGKCNCMFSKSGIYTGQRTSNRLKTIFEILYKERLYNDT